MWIPKYHAGKPDAVWIWRDSSNPPPKQLTAIPHGSAVKEDYLHDWSMVGDQMKYHGVGTHGNNPFWLILQFGTGPEVTKKCLGCGKEIPGSAVFCPDCGAKQKTASIFKLDNLPLTFISGFKTGSPVTFTYLRNPAKAPNMGSRFGQDIEPSGFYVIAADSDAIAEGAKERGWLVGKMTFMKPLVLAWGGYGPDGWKQKLSDACGGRKKGSLTRFLLAQGFDGIVTINRGDTSEIVSLKGTSTIKTASYDLLSLYARRGELNSQHECSEESQGHWRHDCPLCGNRSMCRCMERNHEGIPVCTASVVCYNCEEKLRC